MGRAELIVSNLEVPVDGLSNDLAGLRIAHVSDLHLRRWNTVTQILQDRLRTIDYDVLVATGDFAGRPRRWARAGELLARLIEPVSERTPAYAVLGNHDHPRLAEMEGLPIRFLRNEVVVVPFGGGEFRLAGVEQNHFGGEDLIKTLPGSRQDGLEVLLAHYPSTVYRIPHGRVQLVLSGHTHGGQIRWPFFGCLWTNDALPNRLAHGLHWVNGTWLHVTSGVGVTPPVKVRINCPAELSVLTLKQAYYMPPERMDHDPKRITVLSDSGV